jgi:hypothetical protein
LVLMMITSSGLGSNLASPGHTTGRAGSLGGP